MKPTVESDRAATQVNALSLEIFIHQGRQFQNAGRRQVVKRIGEYDSSWSWSKAAARHGRIMSEPGRAFMFLSRDTFRDSVQLNNPSRGV